LEADDPRPPGGRLAGGRILIGFVQGVALYALSEAGKRHGLSAPVFGALFLTLAFVPVAALGAIGAMRRRSVAIWLAGAALLTAGLGAYDGAIRTGKGDLPGPGLMLGLAAALFIGHHLTLAADQGRRWLAPYARYFDNGWRDGARLALSAAFVGALWLLLGLGAQLFNLIGLKTFGKVIGEPWFAWPVTATCLALGVHLTDVRAALVRGVRTLALTLLSYLLPVMTLIALSFEVALLFTGLEPLWKTRSAGAILLSAAAALVILVNAAYQDGARATSPPRVLKWSGRAAALLIAPLTAVAAYGLWLRIGQHGLTPDRIRAGACVLVAAGYAGGYAAAAVARGAWLKGLERTNVYVAHFVVVLLIVLFSPIADPRRLSVDDQMRRLASGRIAPDAFDFKFLRFDAGRYGERALKELAAHPPGPKGAQIAALARKAQAAESRYDVAPPDSPGEHAAKVRVAGGGALPADFLQQSWPDRTRPLSGCEYDGASCAAAVVDLDGDGVAEVLILSRGARTAYRRTDGRWTKAGEFLGSSCPDETDSLAAGRFSLPTQPTPWRDLEIGGRRLRFFEDTPCQPAAK
jgi:hypothetical protein